MLNVGILGAGAIAPPYYAAVSAWPQLRLTACASRVGDSARAIASRYGIEALSFDDMLADRGIDVIVNLTPAQVHHETSMRILAAGKHLYSEKPLASTFHKAREIVEQAAKRNLRVGCAPDTFMGAAHQEARAAVDAGRIGAPVFATVFLGSRGSEAWHPNPAPFYAAGGGPVSDHAPYYLTQLINLVGPIRAVQALGVAPRALRQARDGSDFPVEVFTTAGALLEFVSGVTASAIFSWDVHKHSHRPIEVYGSEGTLLVPDPNWSDGEVLLSEEGRDWQALDHSSRVFHRPTMITFQGTQVAYYRLCGLADMADAIEQRRPHRANGDLALHVAEVIDAVRIAAETSARVAIETRCERPAPVGDDIRNAAEYRPFGEGLLDARTLF